jgi:hypothetical protein
MLRFKNTLTLVFVLAAVGVAIATAVGILMLPTVGSVRYPPNDPRSAVSQLRSSLQGIGFSQPTGTIQFLLKRDQRPLAFRGATYWASTDIDTRRDDYLGAGSIAVLTLLLAAFVLERRTVATT